jgi:hypothetical protein
LEQFHDSHNAELLIVNASERIHATKPQTEELIGPVLGFQDLKRQHRVVVDGVDDHLHEMDLVGLELDLLAGEHIHSHGYKAVNALVDVTRQAQHHGLSKLAGAYPINAANLGVGEHVGDHSVQRLHILRLLKELRHAKVNEVVKRWKHVLKIELSSRLEGGVNELKSLPHGWGNSLGGEGAAVNDLENLVVEIYRGPVSMPVAVSNRE